jgi:hypothetical protein
VGTATGPVRLGEVRPAGKRAMAAADWARGVRPVPGERLDAEAEQDPAEAEWDQAAAEHDHAGGSR